MVSGCVAPGMSQQEERTAVRTYVPQYQYENWAAEAESMDMSLSEFVRSMVQAGRRGFQLDGDSATKSASHEEPLPAPSNPGGHALEERVLETLDSEGVADWTELVDELSGDFEDRLENAIEALENRDEIRYAPREGGYVRQEGG